MKFTKISYLPARLAFHTTFLPLFLFQLTEEHNKLTSKYQIIMLRLTVFKTMLNPQKVFSLQLVNTDLLNISISSWFSQLLMHDIYIKEKHIHASHTMHIVNILATILGGWKLDIWSGTKLTTQSEYNIASYIWLFFFISIAVIEHRYINLRTSHDSEPLTINLTFI